MSAKFLSTAIEFLPYATGNNNSNNNPPRLIPYSFLLAFTTSKSFSCAFAPHFTNRISISHSLLVLVGELSNNSLRYAKKVVFFQSEYSIDVVSTLLCQYFMNVEYVRFESNSSVTHQDLLPLLMNHPTICDISFENCPNVDAAALYVRLIERHPREIMKKSCCARLGDLCRDRVRASQNTIAAYNAGALKAICGVITPSVHDIHFLSVAIDTLGAVGAEKSLLFDDVKQILPSVDLCLHCSDKVVSTAALCCFVKLLQSHGEEIVSEITSNFHHWWARIEGLARQIDLLNDLAETTSSFFGKIVVPLAQSVLLLRSSPSDLDAHAFAFKILQLLFRKMRNPFNGCSLDTSLVTNSFDFLDQFLRRSPTNKNNVRKDPSILESAGKLLMMMMMKTTNTAWTTDFTRQALHYCMAVTSLRTVVDPTTGANMVLTIGTVQDIPVVWNGKLEKDDPSSDVNLDSYSSMSDDELLTLHFLYRQKTRRSGLINPLSLLFRAATTTTTATTSQHHHDDEAPRPRLLLTNDAAVSNAIHEVLENNDAKKKSQKNRFLSTHRDGIRAGITAKVMNLHRYGQGLPFFLVQANFVEVVMVLGNKILMNYPQTRDGGGLAVTLVPWMRTLVRIFVQLVCAEQFEESLLSLHNNNSNNSAKNCTYEVFVGTHRVNEFGDVVSRFGEDDENYLKFVPRDARKKFLMKDRELLELLRQNYESDEKIRKNNDLRAVEHLDDEKLRITNSIFDFFKRKKEEYYYCFNRTTNEKESSNLEENSKKKKETIEQELIRTSSSKEEFLKKASELYLKQPKKYNNNNNNSNNNSNPADETSRRRQRDEILKVVTIEGNKPGDVKLVFGRLQLLRRVCRLFAVEEEQRLSQVMQTFKMVHDSAPVGEVYVKHFDNFMRQVAEVYRLARM